MSRIVVLISGSGSNLQALIDAQQRNELEGGQVVSVISSSKKAYGLTRAINANIPSKICSLYSHTEGIAKTDKVGRAQARIEFEKDLAQTIVEYKPDVVVCAGWLLILGPTFLSKIGSIPVINLHPALPGQFDGTTHAIEMAWNHCQETNQPFVSGCMVHYVIQEVDKGEPLVIKKLNLIPGKETLEEYEQRVHKAEHIAIVEATKLALGNC
ncbi:hypothetical protein KAFR_0E03420 [Kazachstania africana CBS 2517]|uniref:Phosphoribosylglycinamide formyltransferase n=1 Tax=Kazachstania africana (strain ATCC 22294 / BCRC 22015 / CBS 2517 / CECT 1963 / NBRC 1671 / NRRL Y-8276) TaxID=1071382 RepID=H2AVU4_KAZAF|nr:hypothetical protein KAFR_0E03420 [Kazachstania africana CBS 2517]CCF58494.1 hypothetical protein KAFR_0E03420 [Kazachstania africana CBS 2517]